MSSRHRQSSTSYVYEVTRKNDQVKYRTYEKGKQLGRGGFAVCYKTKRQYDQRVFALKEIKINDKKEHHSHPKDCHKGSKHQHRLSPEEKAHLEAKLLRMCSHHNIVKYETDFIFENSFFIVMEYCENGSFSDMLKKRGVITEVEARYYIRQMIHGLQYLRSKKIIHRDLKPGNYLLTSSLQLKISDFGLATEMRHNGPFHKNVCGTPNYISPQMVNRQTYSYEVDVWAVGVILYSMLYGVPPFETKNKDANETYEKIKKCDYELSDPRVSVEAKDLISKILVLDPLKRITLQSILGHSFMTNFKIPHQLPSRSTKQAPDQKFMRKYEFNEKQQTQPQKKEENYQKKSKNQRGKTKPGLKYDPSPQNSFEQSFSESSRSPVSYFNSEKKELKKMKSEVKQVEKGQKKKTKSLAQIMKKLQKEDMLTSNPISSESSSSKSIKFTRDKNKNKCIQYPSESNHSHLQFVQINNHHKGQQYIDEENVPSVRHSNRVLNHHHEVIMTERQQLCIEQEKRNVLTEQTYKKEVQPKPFPSFQHMMKQLSFEFVRDNPKYNKYLQFDRESFVKPVIVRQDGGRDGQKHQGVGGIAMNAASGLIEGQDNKIYTLEDFVVFSPSIHQRTQKMVKLTYCLKEQQPTDANPLSPPYHFNQPPIRFIGTIFCDNSSIITMLYPSTQSNTTTLSNKSIYIHNVQAIMSNQKIDFTKGINNVELVERGEDGVRGLKHQQWEVIEGVDMVEGVCGKGDQGKDGHWQRGGEMMKGVSFQFRLKVKYAKDSVRGFRKLLLSSYPQLLTTHHTTTQFPTNPVPPLPCPPLCPTPTLLSPSPPLTDTFRFIRAYRSRHSSTTMYIELNDGSKHYMQQQQRSPQSYLDLFRSSRECERRQYHVLVYVKGVGYLKEPGREGVRRVEVTDCRGEKGKGDKGGKGDGKGGWGGEKMDGEAKVKVCEDDYDDEEEEEQEENQRQNCTKKRKVNEHLHQKKDPTSSTHYKPPTASSLITQMCYQFRQKLDMFYIRQRCNVMHSSLLHSKTHKKPSDHSNQVNSSSVNKTPVSTKNDSCWAEVKGGRMDFRMDRTVYCVEEEKCGGKKENQRGVN